jgi:hypothetical protein
LFQKFSVKCHFQCAFDDDSSVMHDFIKQILRAPEQAGGMRQLEVFILHPQFWLWLRSNVNSLALIFNIPNL